MTNLVFFGSNNYSVQILQTLLTIPEFKLQAVVTKPNAPVGRKQILTPNPVADFAIKHSLSLYQPTEFDQKFISDFGYLQPDLAICVAYGPPFFTPKMCQIPKYGIINLHPSPLPKYRGAAPGPWQIINGETSSAISFFLIDELPDHGPIIATLSFPILPADTSATFYDKAFSLAAANLESVLKKYLINPTSLQIQDHSQKTYFPKLTKDSGKIDWLKSPEYNERFIRAMHPWPIAWTYIKNASEKVLRMQILTCSLKNGILEPIDVKIEGRAPTNWSQYKKYYRILFS